MDISCHCSVSGHTFPFKNESLESLEEVEIHAHCSGDSGHSATYGAFGGIWKDWTHNNDTFPYNSLYKFRQTCHFRPHGSPNEHHYCHGLDFAGIRVPNCCQGNLLSCQLGLGFTERRMSILILLKTEYSINLHSGTS